jgi:hypothetical protein
MADFKPNDFFVGVIDFFGILVPGAVLLYLRGEYLLGLLGKDMPPASETIAYWVLFGIGSYLLGQILLGAGVPLNRLADCFWPERGDQFYSEVRKRIDLPKAIENRANGFYRAFSFVRLNSASALVEIERQAAEYKLFRSLTLVFLFDSLLSFAAGHSLRALTSGVLFLVSAGRFLFLLDWTRRITFEFYALLTKPGTGVATEPHVDDAPQRPVRDG